MKMEEKIKELRQAILDCDAERAKVISEQIDINKNFAEVVDALKTALAEMGGKFERGEIYLPHLVMAADAAMGVYDVMKSRISTEEVNKLSQGTIVLGTVQGDMHDIGVNIVGMMLTSAGFNVVHLGKDVPTEAFVNKAKEVKADVIGLSSLMTVSMPKMKEVLEELERKGMRNKVKVILGGGPVSEEWARSIGADGYGRDAIDAVRVLKEWLKAEA